MPYSVSYNAELHFIELKPQGDFTIQDVSAWTDAAVRLAKEKRCERFLNDFRQAQPKLTTLEIHSLPQMLQQIYDTQGVDVTRVKRALIVGAGLDDFRFFEDVSANRGQRVKIFTDPDEALRWILEDSDPPAEESPPRD